MHTHSFTHFSSSYWHEICPHRKKKSNFEIDQFHACCISLDTSCWFQGLISHHTLWFAFYWSTDGRERKKMCIHCSYIILMEGWICVYCMIMHVYSCNNIKSLKKMGIERAEPLTEIITSVKQWFRMTGDTCDDLMRTWRDKWSFYYWWHNFTAWTWL